MPAQTAIAPSDFAPPLLHRTGASRLRVAVVSGWEEFVELRGTWERLQADVPPHSNYCHWEWIEAWHEVSAETQEVLTLVVYDGEAPIGIVPFQHDRERGKGRFHRLRMLGYAGYAEPYCLVEEPICMVAHEQAERVWAAVDRTLASVLAGGGFDCTVYRRTASDAPTKGLSVRPGAIFELRHAKRGPMIAETDGDWGAYRRQLSRSMRDNLSYYPKLLKRHGHTVTVDWITNPREMDEACETLVGLHRLRAWQDVKARQKDYFESVLTRDLLRASMAKMAAAGKGFVGILRIDGVAVAAQAFLRSNASLTLLYSGFDTRWAKYSPLFVLQATALRRASDEGLQHFDLLTGQAPWQKRWAAKTAGQIEKVVQIRFTAASFFPLLRFVILRQAKIVGLRSKLLRKLRAIARSRSSVVGLRAATLGRTAPTPRALGSHQS